MTDQRTAIDWAYQIRDLVDVHYPDAERISLVSVHPETLPKLKLWIPRYPLFGVQSFSFGNIFGVSGWTLVMDNLNTHCGASLYKAFEPEEARRILERLDFHYTPKHGSWLNMAEIELSILSSQCLDRRIPDQEILKKEVTAWVNQRNDSATEMDWRFTTEDARIKLRRLYPSIQP